MLVLTRRSGESILIGGEIRVRVLRTSGSRVRIGIEAPSDVRIVREKAEEGEGTAEGFEELSFEALPARRPRARDAVTRNTSAEPRAGRETVPAPRQPAEVDRHMALE